MGFANFINNKKNGSELSAFSTESIKKEMEVREENRNIFPLDVFHDNLKPFIKALNHHYDIPRSYIGLALLSAYSTAIGTAYAVSPNGSSLIYMPVWGCLSGISSSGKSLAIDMTYDPLNKIQAEFDRDWLENIEPQPEEARRRALMKTVMFRDAHIATLVRNVMPDNPKGVCKYADEIMEWINGMNQLSKKEGTDEQFWISSWNCKSYSGMRSNKVKFVIPRPFVNVIGGVQPTIMYKLFAKDRDTTGFIFRLLFALPDVIKIAEPDSNYYMLPEVKEPHTNCINRLYNDLNIEDPYENPRKVLLSREAIKKHEDWTRRRINIINNMEEISDKEIHSGILGKMKEYAYRFAGILALVDRACNMDPHSMYGSFNYEEQATGDVMERALRLADYFYQSAADIYESVQTKMTAPAEVLIAATLFRQRASYAQVAKALYGDEKHKQRAWRDVKRWIKEYPKIFGAEAK